MPERIHQLRFDPETQIVTSQEVTPPGFRGLTFPPREPPVQLSRFVREASALASITSPQDAGKYLRQYVYTPFEAFDQEEVWVLLLNTKNQITHEAMVYRGTVNTAYIRVVELFKEAIRVNAPAIIFSHCHPSGDPTPSPNDIEMTRAGNEVAHLLSIELLDHIIVGSDTWVSLKQQGLGF